jgi:outer membrane protein assembly factor BamB
MEEWPTLLLNSARTGSMEESFAPPLRVLWKKRTPFYIWASPVIKEGLVCMPDFDQGVYALYLESGEEAWRRSEFGVRGRSSLTVVGDLLLVPDVKALTALDIRSGETRWEIEGSCGHCTPCVENGTVYWGTKEATLRAAEIANGSLKWESWLGASGDVVPSATLSSVFANSGPRVWAVNAMTGEQIWTKQFVGNQPIAQAAMSVADGRVIVSVVREALVALDAGTGEEIWRAIGDSPPTTSPCVVREDGVVYVAGSKLAAVSLETGNRLWETDRYGFSTSAPIAVGDTLYIGGGHWRRVYGFARKTGREIWNFETKDLVYSTPSYSAGHLLVGSHDHNLYCLVQAGDEDQQLFDGMR